MGVGAGRYTYVVVVKSSRSLSHLLMSSCLWMSMDGLGTKCRRYIGKNFNRLSRVNERYRRQMTDDRLTDRQTDGRATAYSERECLLKIVTPEKNSFLGGDHLYNGRICYRTVVCPVITAPIF